MSKLNPAVRTGLIWAGVHQSIALLVLWTSQGSLFQVVQLLFVADSPIIFAAGTLGLPLWHPTWMNFLATDSNLPNFLGLMVWMLTLGAAQWFAIGYLFVAYLNRRGSKQKRQNSA